ncbi:MAG TPA: hypothetical protein VMS88_05945 [Terriglobales bacterium]|nr:hypothetical protein [Terriglobales bacterium]
MAMLTAAGFLLSLRPPAACAAAATAGPFETVPIGAAPRTSHRWAYVSLAAGAGLAGLSFAITARANRTYDEYLQATDPAEATRLYDRTVHFDRLAGASLLGGEALVAFGVWLRFLHRPARPATISLGPGRCAVSLRF